MSPPPVAMRGLVEHDKKAHAFDGLPPSHLPFIQMVALARRDWMGLRRVLPQLLMATGNAEEAETLLRQVIECSALLLCTHTRVTRACTKGATLAGNQRQEAVFVGGQLFP